MAQSQEHLLPHIAYPELYAPEAVHDQLTRDILLTPRSNAPVPSEEGVPNKPTVSPIDLRRIASEMTDQEILERKFLAINVALDDAHRYLEEELNLTVPTAEVHSKKDIVELIKKTALYKESNKKGLEKHAGYCALVSVALAVFELQKKKH